MFKIVVNFNSICRTPLVPSIVRIRNKLYELSLHFQCTTHCHQRWTRPGTGNRWFFRVMSRNLCSLNRFQNLLELWFFHGIWIWDNSKFETAIFFGRNLNRMGYFKSIRVRKIGIEFSFRNLAITGCHFVKWSVNENLLSNSLRKFAIFPILDFVASPTFRIGFTRYFVRLDEFYNLFPAWSPKLGHPCVFFLFPTNLRESWPRSIAGHIVEHLMEVFVGSEPPTAFPAFLGRICNT